MTGVLLERVVGMEVARRLSSFSVFWVRLDDLVVGFGLGLAGYTFGHSGVRKPRKNHRRDTPKFHSGRASRRKGCGWLVPLGKRCPT